MTRLVEPLCLPQTARAISQSPHRIVAGVLGLLAAVGLVLAASASGCAGSDEASKDPSQADSGKRNTELEHEDCDLESSSARRLDANRDGNADIITVMDGNRPACRAADINMDKVIDVFVYFDAAGKQRRRESGFDRDMRPDEVSIYQNGVLVRKERETNNDAKIDTWDYYQGGRLVREERDSTGDAFVDQWWTFNRPGNPKCATVVSDEDGDGKPEKDSQIDLCADAGTGQTATSASANASAESSAPAASAQPSTDEEAP